LGLLPHSPYPLQGELLSILRPFDKLRVRSKAEAQAQDGERSQTVKWRGGRRAQWVDQLLSIAILHRFYFNLLTKFLVFLKLPLYTKCEVLMIFLQLRRGMDEIGFNRFDKFDKLTASKPLNRMVQGKLTTRA
jgi:hypothetical protein